MIYKYTIRKKAMKFISGQEQKQQKRILKAIYALPIGDVRKMSGYEKLYRLRVGGYRILFEMNLQKEEIILIDITDIDNRGQIYK